MRAFYSVKTYWSITYLVKTFWYNYVNRGVYFFQKRTFLKNEIKKGLMDKLGRKVLLFWSFFGMVNYV